jgi:hypothetical protein
MGVMVGHSFGARTSRIRSRPTPRVGLARSGRPKQQRERSGVLAFPACWRRGTWHSRGRCPRWLVTSSQGCAAAAREAEKARWRGVIELRPGAPRDCASTNGGVRDCQTARALGRLPFSTPPPDLHHPATAPALVPQHCIVSVPRLCQAEPRPTGNHTTPSSRACRARALALRGSFWPLEADPSIVSSRTELTLIAESSIPIPPGVRPAAALRAPSLQSTNQRPHATPGADDVQFQPKQKPSRLRHPNRIFRRLLPHLFTHASRPAKPPAAGGVGGHHRPSHHGMLASSTKLRPSGDPAKADAKLRAQHGPTRGR